MPTIFNILTHPHKNLRKRAQEVDLGYLKTDECKTFLKNFTHTMRVKDGVGLAAVQVDTPKRIICIIRDVLSKEERAALGLGRHDDLILVNPEWFPLSQKKAWGQEGCLSVPGLWGDVERTADIQVTALNKHGERLAFKATDFFSRVIQHEVDHNNGILFIDKAHNLTKNTNGIKA